MSAKNGNDDRLAEHGADNAPSWTKSKIKIYICLLALSIAWTFLFTAFFSISNLQSTLNNDRSLGTTSLALVYAVLLAACFFFPTLVIKLIGLKWGIVISQLTYLIFVAVNLYPRWATLLPASVLLGFGASSLWTCKLVYLTNLASYYAKLSGESRDVMISRFMGIFFSFFSAGQIIGNLMSSLILKPEIPEPSNSTTLVLSPFSNLTEANSSSVNKFAQCGVNNCPYTVISSSPAALRPQMSTVYLLCGILIGFIVLSMLIIAFLLRALKVPKDENESKGNICTNNLKVVVEFCKHLKNRNQLLVTPITMWLGFMIAFIGAEFTRSYVACTKGIHNVGYFVIIYGATNTIANILLARVIKYTGALAVFSFGLVVNYIILGMMYFWNPDTMPSMIFAMPVLLGVTQASWEPQVNSLYAILFPHNKEIAFSHFRFWESLGFAITYAYSGSFCINVKLYLLLAYSTISYAGYLAVYLTNRHHQEPVVSYH